MNKCKVYKWKLMYTSLNDNYVYEVKFSDKEEMKDYINELIQVGSIDNAEDVIVINLLANKVV